MRRYHATAIYISAKRKCLIAFPENRRRLSNYASPARRNKLPRMQLAHARALNNHMSFKSPTSESSTFKNSPVSVPGLVRQVDAIWPKLGKNGTRASQLKVGAEECSSRWRAGDEKNIAKLGVRTLIPTRGYQPSMIHGGIASDTYVTFTHIHTWCLRTYMRNIHAYARLLTLAYAHVLIFRSRPRTYRYTLELFRKSDNENTLRYTLVPEDIPIGKVYQKVQQLQQLVGVTLS